MTIDILGKKKKKPMTKRWYLEVYDDGDLRVVKGKDGGGEPKKKHPKHQGFFGPYATKEGAYKAGLNW
jgi:hypothetical protein